MQEINHRIYKHTINYLSYYPLHHLVITLQQDYMVAYKTVVRDKILEFFSIFFACKKKAHELRDPRRGKECVYLRFYSARAVTYLIVF